MDRRDVLYLAGQGILWLSVIGLAWWVSWLLGYLKR